MKTIFVICVLAIVVSQIFAEEKCGPNEYVGCLPCCPEEEPTCENKSGQFECTNMCPKICISHCRCSPGYCRDTKGQCVPE
uniref:Venom peptide BmKAPI-like isoform X2 n=1 Tax=Diabrotica virgifera virgifera TaxID=50390 RepID=A0A6P7G353_DIAVI